MELGTAVQTWLNHPGYPDTCPPGIQRRGQRAKDRFVSANLRLAVSYISKHCNRLAKDHSIDDLVQAANIGLIRAVERFDPARGYRFSTYAYWWIRQSVNHYADTQSRTIAIPGSHSQHLSKLAGIRRRMALELNRDPTSAELAAELGVSMKVFEQLLINARSISSLDATIADDGGTLADCIASDAPSFEEQQDQQDDDHRRAQLQHLITELPNRHQRVLRSAYGLDGEVISLRQLAKAEGLKVREIQAIIQSAQEQLKAAAVQLSLLSVSLVQVMPRPAVKRPRRSPDPDQLLLPIAMPSPPAPSPCARRKPGRPKAAHQPMPAALQAV
ncbi:MAG: sigma-70 family RNA polymerase sigma factor [Cyanobacteriota bacterium]|nr:sigma-70 family RNA polymerase sigma factor [Cyanobacteriota bacterium]